MNRSILSKNNRRHWKPVYFLLILQLFCLARICSGQRVISSLGAKLKRSRNKNRGNSRQGGREYVVEGEEETTQTFCLPFTNFNCSEEYMEYFLAFGLGSVSLLIFALYNTWKSTEQEGEWVHESILELKSRLCFQCNLTLLRLHESQMT